MVGYWGHAQPPSQSQSQPPPPPSSSAEERSLYEALVLEERRRDARRAGARVGDLEEELALASALSESREERHEEEEEEEQEEEVVDLRPILEEEDDDDVVEWDDDESSAFSVAQPSRKTEEQTSALLFLPLELVTMLMSYITVEGAMLGAAASREYAAGVASEAVAEVLCRRIFKGCRPERWRGWRGMLGKRPRVRVSGVYALRQTRSKPVKQDMFTPKELKGTFWQEVAWWRYFRFFEDGTVIYALQNDDGTPQAKVTNLLHKRSSGPSFSYAKNATKKSSSSAQNNLGRYTLRRRECVVEVALPHATMVFDLGLEDGEFGGRFTRLRLDRHTQLDARDPGRPVVHALQEESRTLTFLRVPE